ncbi:MAG: hypothetical protein Kow0027_28630 [Saprospiraceae bacterium]
MASKAQVSDTWRGQRDTIPWHLMDLAGPRSKPGFLHGHPTEKYPVLPMIGGAIVGGGVVWLLTRDGGGGESTLLVPHDDAMTIACGESTVTLNVLNNDEGDGLKVVSVSPPPGIEVIINGGNLTVSGIGPASITFSYSVEDASGKVLSANVSITVIDEQAPVLTCPADVSVLCSSEWGVNETGMATATDACAGSQLSIDWQDDMSGLTGCGNSGTLIRTFSAEDPAGNSSQCNQVIEIFQDSTPPEIFCPPSVAIPCTVLPNPPLFGMATAADDCAMNIEISWQDFEGTDTLYREWKATDECGNSAYCVQKMGIGYVEPHIYCPYDAIVSCEMDPSPDITGSLSILGVCTSEFEVFYQDDLTGLTECNGTGDLLRTWSLTTALGDSVACQQIITIIDETPPSITCPPTTTAACSGTPDPDPTTTGFPEGEDNCSMDLNFDYTDDASGVTNCEGDLVRTWTATDECGNSSTCEQTITMEPSVAPEITCPATMTVECNVVPDPTVTGEAAATFHCGDPTAGSLVYEDDDSGLGGCNGTGTLIRTWTATDDCGNSSSCTQSIAVEDNTPPVVTCPGNAEAVCMEPNDPSVTGMAVATDNCSSTPGLVYEDDDSGVMNCKGSMIRTWTATDDCGNAASCDQLINILPPPCTFTTSFSVANADCGLANGVAVANVSPAGNYAYLWSNGTTGLVLSDVPAGNYHVTITDVDLSCELTFEVTIGENPPQYVTGLVVSPADCPNGGDISFIVSGGQGPYEVVVSGPAGTNSIQNIPNGTEVHVNVYMPVGPGNYTIQVTDQAAGPQCTEVFTVSVSEAPPYALQVLQVNPPSSPSAPDGSIQLQVVNPGAYPPPYQVIVNGDVVGVANSPVFTIQNLPAGIYEIMVLDQFECPSATVVVELMPMFAFDYSPTVNAFDLNLHLSGGPPEHPNTEHYSVTDMVFLNGSTLTIYRHRQAGNFIAFGLTRAEGQLLAESMKGQRLSSSFQLLQHRLMAGHQFRLPKGNIRLSAGVYARYLQLDEQGLMPSRIVSTGFSLEAGFELPFGKCGVFSLPLSVFPFGKQGREMGFQPRLSWRF